MSRQQTFRAKWKDLDLSGVGDMVPMLLMLGVFALAVFFGAILFGEARGWAMMGWGAFSQARYSCPQRSTPSSERPTGRFFRPRAYWKLARQSRRCLVGWGPGSQSTRRDAHATRSRHLVHLDRGWTIV